MDELRRLCKIVEGKTASNVFSLRKVPVTLRDDFGKKATKLPGSRRKSVPARGRCGGSIMPDTLFVMAAGAGFFLAMYQWVTMIAETLP